MVTRPWTATAKALAPSAYRNLLDATLDIVAIYDRDGRILFINRAVERVLGYAAEELIGHSVFEYFHPEDRDRARARFEAIASDPSETGRAAVYRLRTTQGGYRDLEALSVNRLDDPRVGGICMVVRDVSERVASERKLAGIVERRQLAARIARLGIWEWDPETNELIAEDAVRDLVRARPDQPWQSTEEFLARFAPEDRAPLEGAVREAAAGGAPADVVARMPLPDGSLRWLYVHAEPWPPGSRRLLGLVMDITAQKDAEEQISKRNEMFSLAAWGAGLGVWEWSPVSDRIINDQSSAALIGLAGGAGERPADEWERAIHPEDLPELQRLRQRLVAGEADSLQCAYRARRDAQGWHWLLDRGRVAGRGADGRALRIVGVTLDFDEAKQRELELAGQRLRLDLALSASGLGLWDLDVAANEIYVDERYSRIIGMSAEQLRRNPRSLAERLHPDEREHVLALVTDCIEGRAETLRFEGRLLQEGGRLGWIRIDGMVAGRDADGHPVRLVGTIADLTERRRREQMMRIGEQTARLGSYEFDVGDDRFYWSEGVYRIFEFPDSFVPLRGATIGLLSDSSQPRVREAFAAARESGRSFDLELEARTATGRPIWVRMTGRADLFEERPVRVYGIVQDVTERRFLEASLLEVSNREQQRFGRELHDGIGQELTGISMMLQGLAGQVKAINPSFAEPCGRLGELLSRTISHVRSLAHGLAPVSTEGGGLEAALRLLAERSAETGGAAVSFELQGATPLTLGEAAGNHLYRIAQEAVSNAVRHGRATQITIGLAVSADRVTLSVADNGRGLAQDHRERGGLGLRSMAYRARNLDGSFSLSPRPGGGTLVEVDCPQPPQ